ncbi:MAG: EAL domain-containing protein [Candidatus Accumulibacter sp.]|jgi:diguanylate cyclase (GGDEF)-like protein/PAS domain S-box-containing protein|nr:EAL domain-containing protein [Accumulibacter sp.]
MPSKAPATDNDGQGEGLLRNTLFTIGGVALLFSIFFILIALSITQRHIEQETQQSLDDLSESMSVMASIACFAKDATLANETVSAFTNQHIIHRVTITANGQLLATGTRQGCSSTATGDDGPPPIVKTLYSPFDANDKIGEVTLEPCWDEIQKNVDDNVHNVAIILVSLAIAIICMIASVISRTVVRPVQSISERLHTLNVESDETLAIPRGHDSDEIGRLVKDANDMISRLRMSLAQEHELHLQRVLNEKLRLYASMFENSQNGIFITDRHNRIITVNRAFTQITGFTESEALGRNPHFMSSGRHDQAFYQEMWRELLTFDHWTGELWNRCKDGQIKPKWFSISVVRGEEGEIVNHIAFFSDISERKKAEERFDFLAHHDALTQLPNRLLARDRFAFSLEAAARDKSNIAILYIDLDSFKYVNDTFGHQVGDQLLLSVSERMKSVVRETDTISREGGDEFMIILPGIKDNDILCRIANNILGKLMSPFEIVGQTIGISASIGIACYPEHGEDFDTLLKNADAAMYAAKNSGKNAYRIFSAEMNVDALDKLQLRASLFNAFEGDEFHIVFQPQIDLTTLRLVGCEVLCRWTHPGMGPIPPIRFIALAEESGLINPLGEWVLREACLQGKHWFDSGVPPFVIAVNVSSQQFNHSELVTIVRRVLKETEFPVQYLELEFTESGLLDNIERSLDIIDELRALGIKLSIDDFGTGYSSLIYLKQFKVDKLKIDQSFVRDIDDPEDRGIVRAIIQMGKTLQLKVIAEGVETEEQKDVLNGLECNEVQGYLVSKPLPPPEFKEFIARWRAQHERSQEA